MKRVGLLPAALAAAALLGAAAAHAADKAYYRIETSPSGSMIATDIPVRIRYCGHNSAIPIPFRNTPRTISRKYRIGFTTVSH